MNKYLLLNDFLSLDCPMGIRQELLAEIASHEVGSEVLRDYAFNVFNIRLDFEKGQVQIEVDFDTSEDGSCSMSLEEFTAALKAHRPPR